MELRRVCVFCGSRPGDAPVFTETAAALGRELVDRGLGLVFGGGSVGLMGTVADAVLEAGGEVVGVIPRELWDREVGHADCTELHVVDSMHERKALMASLSDAFIAQPGGIGTLEELAEAVTWNQLGIHAKPVGLLDVDGFWDPLVATFDRFVERGFLEQAARGFVLSDTAPGPLLDALAAWEPVPVQGWKAGSGF